MFSNKFIRKSGEYTTKEKGVPAPYFRKSFELKEIPASAEITVCGLGFYRLYVNGREITKGCFAPYISNPDIFCYYDRYRVEDCLQRGANVIAVLLGNGLLNNPHGDIWDFDKAPFRAAPKLALALKVDGELLFEADESFKTACSPVIFDDYRCGEHYDARKEILGWNTAEFDDSQWDNAERAEAPKGEKTFCNAEPVKKLREYAPEFKEKSGGVWIYGFPYNGAGFCRLKINGKKGQKIALAYGEVYALGKLDLTNIKFGDRSSDDLHKDVYICKGEGEEIYEPSFTYHGFKYVAVEGINDGQATDDLLTYIDVYSDIAENGSFVCSDAVINEILACTLRSDLSCFHYFPTDCPQREKNGWTGDITLSAEQLMLNLHAENSLKEWLKNLRGQQREDGCLPCIVPTDSWGYETLRPAWDAAVVQVPYYIYKYTADKSVIYDNISAILRYLRYADSQKDENGMWKNGLGDWCEVDTPLAWKYNTPRSLTNFAAVIDCCYKTMRMLKAIGEADGADFSFVKSMYETTKKNCRKAYIENGECKEEFATQTALAVMIYYRIFDETERKAATERLVRKIRDNDGKLRVGVLGNRALYRVLFDNGYEDLAYEMITDKDFPSFAEMTSHGTGTLWESFVKLDGDSLIAQSGRPLDSLNHHFWGDVTSCFFRDLAGIRINPKLEDPYLIEIKPKFIKALDGVRAEITYLGEKLSVEWKRVDGEVHMKTSVPKKFRLLCENGTKAS